MQPVAANTGRGVFQRPFPVAFPVRVADGRTGPRVFDGPQRQDAHSRDSSAWVCSARTASSETRV